MKGFCVAVNVEEGRLRCLRHLMGVVWKRQFVKPQAENVGRKEARADPVNSGWWGSRSLSSFCESTGGGGSPASLQPDEMCCDLISCLTRPPRRLSQSLANIYVLCIFTSPPISSSTNCLSVTRSGGASWQRTGFRATGTVPLHVTSLGELPEST